MDEATLIKALGRRHDANLLEVGSFTDPHGQHVSLVGIIEEVRHHGGARKVTHGTTNHIHIICDDNHQIILKPHEEDEEITEVSKTE